MMYSRLVGDRVLHQAVQPLLAVLELRRGRGPLATLGLEVMDEKRGLLQLATQHGSLSLGGGVGIAKPLHFGCARLQLNAQRLLALTADEGPATLEGGRNTTADGVQLMRICSAWLSACDPTAIPQGTPFSEFCTT